MSDYRELIKEAEVATAYVFRTPWTYGNIDSIAGGTIYDAEVAIAHVEWDNEPVDGRIRRTRRAAEADDVGEFIAKSPELVRSLARALRSVLDEQDTVLEAAQDHRATASRALNKISKALSLHDNIPFAGNNLSEWCAECSDPENGMYVSWPCPTVRALSGDVPE